MKPVMTAVELARRCESLAQNYKTLYVMGCFGAPMTAKNRKRYTANHSYNAQKSRTAKIQAAGEDTFGFDCVCMIKGLLWGWQGDSTKVYGGAKYASCDVPDVGADSMFRKCTDKSADFSCLEVGEAVWRSGHIGIYIGNGLAVEATPQWADGVQITACNGAVSGYPARQWSKHGKLPYVSYDGCSLDYLRQCVQMVAPGNCLPVSSMEENRVHILVWLAQKRLHTLLFGPEKCDGVFDETTKAAVLAFQQEKALELTGKLDAKTWAALLEWEEGHE